MTTADDPSVKETAVAQATVSLDLVPDSRFTGPVDNSTIFLTYLSFLGDADKTAAALNVVPAYVRDLAEREHWQVKVDGLRTLRQTDGADALARELNRVSNYVQAVRARNLVDRVLRTVTKSEEEFDQFITQNGKEFSNRSCKTVTDLIKAMQAVHSMTYAALGDTCGERTNRDDEPGLATGVLLKSLATLAGAPVSPTAIDATSAARQILVDVTPSPSTS